MIEARRLIGRDVVHFLFRITTHGKMATLGSRRGCLGIVNSLHAVDIANSMRLVAFNLLSDQANLGARVALVVEAMDDLSVKKLADWLDVFLHALVGEY